jgi:hypothetical protein|tara:strand:+ start:6539 stop:6907 length:369 start_codon:yes stop_codon:yes gene_type:complete
MKLFDTLTSRNFELFASQHYNNPECCDIEEFREDLTRFKYLKRLLRRYEQYGDLQERLILNHIIVLYNVFGIDAANRMMWFKVEPEHYSAIKTFLIFLNYLHEDSKVEIPLDQNVINKLRKL